MPTTNFPPSTSLADAVRARHAARVQDANDTIDKLLARAHAPEAGDDEAAVDATAALVSLNQPYCFDQFAADCSAAVEIRALLAEGEAEEIERRPLLVEMKALRHEIKTVCGYPMPHTSRPIDKRLRAVQNRISGLDARQGARRDKRFTA